MCPAPTPLTLLQTTFTPASRPTSLRIDTSRSMCCRYGVVPEGTASWTNPNDEVWISLPAEMLPDEHDVLRWTGLAAVGCVGLHLCHSIHRAPCMVICPLPAPMLASTSPSRPGPVQVHGSRARWERATAPHFRAESRGLGAVHRAAGEPCDADAARAITSKALSAHASCDA